MSSKWIIFVVKHRVQFLSTLMILAILGYKSKTYTQPLDWSRDISALLVIVGAGLLLALIFWYLFVKEKKVNIRFIVSKQPLQYQCPACHQKWDDGCLPPGNVCPRDGMPLKSFDPIEDRNTYRL